MRSHLLSADFKSSNQLIVWVDYISVFSLPKILKLAYYNNGVVIRFMNSSYIAFYAIKFIKRLNIIQLEYEKVEYSLGDMKIGNETMGMKFQFDLPEIAAKIAVGLKETSIYKEIVRSLPEEKVNIFFEKKISEDIYPIIRFLVIIYWYVNWNKRSNKNILLYSYSPLFHEIKSISYYNDILLESYNDYRYGKVLIMNLIGYVLGKISFCKNIIGNKDNINVLKSNLAVHYTEGLNIKKRSDIFWNSKGIIEPQRILFYFDLNKTSKDPISKSVCNQIKEMGMNWISLGKKDLSFFTGDSWKNVEKLWCNNSYMEVPKMKASLKSPLERWIFITYKILLLDIKRWLKLYNSLNVKIVFDIAAQTTEAIAQCIALDFVNGIRIGAQRSTISMTKWLPFLKYNANHLFFVWGEEANMHQGTSKVVKGFIISGYPFIDSVYDKYSKNNYIDKMKKDGIKLSIALFDNAFTNDLYFSKNMMILFYQKFLNWLIEDREISLIIKEKKPMYFDQLTEIDNLIFKAEKTSRFIRLENAWGRLPSDASRGADMSVGIGVSSALTEAVIAGCRGIHCDLAGHYFHPYYKWGYGKIIFDDIDEMISALKRHKENPNNEPNLGDWSSYIDQLDPFRDGRGGERMGTYMRWLLEAFDCGKNRDEAIQHANSLYAGQWGKDKVIDMNKDLISHR